ncbi:MAG: ABC transporter permease [Flavobacteriaceae bacterium]|jgi:peptide/nickel transport system permease protein
MKVLAKLNQAFWTLFGVVTIIFYLFTVLPGDPAQMMMDQQENSTQLEALKKKFGFDQPLWKQYILYLNDLSPLSLHSTQTENFSHYTSQKYGGLVLLNTPPYQLVLKTPYLRTSYQKRGKTVGSIIAETLPNTFVLAIASIAIAIVLGIGLGILATVYKDGWQDRTLQFFSTLGMSVPSFFSAILFSWLFGYVWHRYTGLNMTGSLYEVDDFGMARYLNFKNLLLPAVVLGIRPLAIIIQLMRSSLIDVLAQDYIRTAKAKGLSTTAILFRHALKNALNPVVTAVSGWFASLLAGAVFVEYIFGWKGLGKEIVDALNTLDIPVIMGAVVTIATLFIVINILVDYLYTLLNPQVN